MHVGNKSFNGYEHNALFRNLGGSGMHRVSGAGLDFVDVGHVSGADRVEDGRGLGLADFDGDGDLDLVIQNYRTKSTLLVNRGGEGNWLQVRLEGTRSNRSAIGARVTIRHGEATQSREVQCGAGYLSSQSLLVHFGLGTAERVDELVVRWPSGARQVLTSVSANQQLEIKEPWKLEGAHSSTD